MTNTEIALGVSCIAALSGWSKLAYDYITAKPRIVGNIYTVFRAHMISSNELTGRVVDAIIFFPYIYITNRRKASVHIRNYKLRIRVNKKWIKLQENFGARYLPLDEKGSLKIGENAIFYNWVDNLAISKDKSIDFGSPLQGWVTFFSEDVTLNDKVVDEYELTCVDAFGKQHIIIVKNKDIANGSSLLELGIMMLDNEYVNDPRKPFDPKTGIKQTLTSTAQDSTHTKLIPPSSLSAVKRVKSKTAPNMDGEIQ